ncbi:hypothetical protein FHG87_015840 [Trinorchestia longiramus]|nr:hypothetical protein FHG87_015840 [Trinorchestia longiramus]
MASIGGPSDPKSPHSNLRRMSSKSPLEQSLNMVSSPPTIAPVTIYPGPGARHANMAKADLDIVQRLQHLRGSTAAPSEAEMAERLAKLKGLPADYYTRSSAAHPALASDNRSDVQKAQDLLSQAMEEARLDAQLPDPDRDLQLRLSQLRGKETGNSTDLAALPLLESPSIPHGFDDAQELRKLLAESQTSASAEAAAAMSALERDPVMRAAVAQSVREKQQFNRKTKHQRGARGDASTSSDNGERVSDSSDEEVHRPTTKVKKMWRSTEKQGTVTGADKLTQDEEDEVSRIVNMYSKRAAEKKKKRLLKKKGTSVGKKSSDPKLMSKCEAKDSETDSSSELTESDLEKTSDSEKLSDSSG